MTASFDIFQEDAGGTVLWLGTTASLDDAKARAQELASRAPGKYLVLDQRTGHKLVVDSSGADQAALSG